MATEYKHMQQRRGTSDRWAAEDPILLEGEIGINTTTNEVKIGDGEKRWSQLTAINPAPYAHPEFTPYTNSDTSALSPAFGGSITLTQVNTNAEGHVVSQTSRQVVIPSNEATTSANGLMSSSDKTKLDGIATGANAYSHPTYTARTGAPTSNVTPGFGDNVTVSQIASNTLGHITSCTNRTIKIPNTEASTTSNGLMTTGQVTALNKTVSDIGDISKLTTVNKASLVLAINSLQDTIRYYNDVFVAIEERMTQYNSTLADLEDRLTYVESQFPGNGNLVITGPTTTHNGITFTNNNNGSITLNGSKTGTGPAVYTAGQCTLKTGGYAIFCTTTEDSTTPSGAIVTAVLYDKSSGSTVASSSDIESMLFNVDDPDRVYEAKVTVSMGSYTNSVRWIKLQKVS